MAMYFAACVILTLRLVSDFGACCKAGQFAVRVGHIRPVTRFVPKRDRADLLMMVGEV